MPHNLSTCFGTTGFLLNSGDSVADGGLNLLLRASSAREPTAVSVSMLANTKP